MASLGNSCLSLPAGEAHLWYVFANEVRDPGLLAAYHRLMCPEEAASQRRFVFEKGRHEYLLTRALVRTVLSRYADVDPAAWTFVRNRWGRPAISGPAGAPRLRFNLSNTDGLIACLVSSACEVGVDVEFLERRGQTVEIADRFFSPFEVDALHRQAPGEQRTRFFQYWTLKESYIKARGMGLAIPLDQFSFHLDEGPTIQISFGDALDDDPQSWQFELFRPSPVHMMAACIRRGKAPDVQIRRLITVPLAEEERV